MTIYISNLGSTIKDEDLKHYFTGYGDVSSAKVILDKFTRQSRGFGFVEMTDDTAAQKAINELHGTTIGGLSLTVNEAKPRQDKKNDRTFLNRW
jgi:RNA recognition motif-containing protein